MTVEQVDQILIWVALAFCIWLVLSNLIRRLPVPSPVLVAATLSWIVANTEACTKSRRVHFRVKRQ